MKKLLVNHETEYIRNRKAGKKLTKLSAEIEVWAKRLEKTENGLTFISEKDLEGAYLFEVQENSYQSLTKTQIKNDRIRRFWK
jgi:hypothetical protein